MNSIITKNNNTTNAVPSTLLHGELAVNTVDKKLFVGDSNGTPVVLNDVPSCTLAYQKPIGEHGGTSRKKKYNVRAVNTVLNDVYNICYIVGDDFVLAKGVYAVTLYCSAFKVEKNKLRIVNETTGATLVEGCSEDLDYGGGAVLIGLVTSNGTDLLEIQHYTEKNQEEYGLGKATKVGQHEVYLTMNVLKVG